MPSEFELATKRLTLKPWRPEDRDDFASMNADHEVMADLGGPLTRAASDEKYERFARSFREHRITRWVVRTHDTQFVGYVGIVPASEDHPLGLHHEIGWRLARNAWGHGYATEAASAALNDGFERLELDEVLAYTASDNVRSQRVMDRLGLVREPERDFEKHYDDVGLWSALVWVAYPPGRV